MKQAAYKIIANGNDITALIADRLIRLTLTDKAGIESDTADIELDNREQKLATPPTGAKLEIYIGYVGELVYKGSYVVDEISEQLEADTLTIKAKAADVKAAIKAPKDESYPATNLGKLAADIAAKHGYELRISSEMKNVELKQVDQLGESDLNLLTRLSSENNGFFKVADNKLVLTKKGESKTVSGKQLPTIEINDPSESTGTVTITERSGYSSVIAHYFDEAKQQKTAVTAGAGEPKFTIKKQFQNETVAKNAAEAKLAELKRGTGTLSLTRPLNPSLLAEATLKISNHKSSANGNWLIESVTHTIADGAVATTSVSCSTKNN